MSYRGAPPYVISPVTPVFPPFDSLPPQSKQQLPGRPLPVGPVPPTRQRGVVAHRPVCHHAVPGPAAARPLRHPGRQRLRGLHLRGLPRKQGGKNITPAVATAAPTFVDGVNYGVVCWVFSCVG